MRANLEEPDKSSVSLVPLPERKPGHREVLPASARLFSECQKTETWPRGGERWPN